MNTGSGQPVVEAQGGRTQGAVRHSEFGIDVVSRYRAVEAAFAPYVRTLGQTGDM